MGRRESLEIEWWVLPFCEGFENGYDDSENSGISREVYYCNLISYCCSIENRQGVSISSRVQKLAKKTKVLGNLSEVRPDSVAC